MTDCELDRLAQRIKRDWLPGIIQTMFPTLLGPDTWLDRTGHRRFWLELFLLPYAPLVILYALAVMLSLTHVPEYLACEEVNP